MRRGGRIGMRRGRGMGPRSGGRNFEDRGPRREIRNQFRGKGRFDRNFQSDRPPRRFQGNDLARGGSRFESGRSGRGSNNFKGRSDNNFRGNGFRRNDRRDRGGRGGRFNNQFQKERLDRQLDNMNKRNPDYMKKKLDDELENYRGQDESNNNQNKP